MNHRVNSRAGTMSEAQRRHIYGPLQTAATVARIGGKPSLMLLACGIVATFAIVAIGA